MVMVMALANHVFKDIKTGFDEEHTAYKDSLYNSVL